MHIVEESNTSVKISSLVCIIFLTNKIYFQVVLGSQQYWAENTESSVYSLRPPHIHFLSGWHSHCGGTIFFFFNVSICIFFLHKCWYFIYFFLIFFISWRLITLHYGSGFCHTLKWTSHGFTCVPHPDPPSHLP